VDEIKRGWSSEKGTKSMYENYWQLQAKPFEDAIDTDFYYPSSDHQAALLKLRYAIENRRSATVLTGSSGTGKTMLLQCLLQQLPEHIAPIAHLVFPQMPADQLLASLADRLCGPVENSDIRRSLQRLEQFLENNASSGQHALIIIDEAHLLAENGTLELIRLLTNLHWNGRPVLTVMLSGLPRLLTSLERMPELEQRVAVKCVLSRFTETETACYVQHRLHAAGNDSPIFDASALKALHEMAQGVPRRINRLADLSLIVGFAGEQHALTAEHVDAVAEELSACS
jgi:type II secretory pathway predicted ATPase ExeA